MRAFCNIRGDFHMEKTLYVIVEFHSGMKMYVLPAPKIFIIIGF